MEDLHKTNLQTDNFSKPVDRVKSVKEGNFIIRETRYTSSRKVWWLPTKTKLIKRPDYRNPQQSTESNDLKSQQSTEAGDANLNNSIESDNDSELSQDNNSNCTNQNQSSESQHATSDKSNSKKKKKISLCIGRTFVEKRLNRLVFLPQVENIVERFMGPDNIIKNSIEKKLACTITVCGRGNSEVQIKDCPFLDDVHVHIIGIQNSDARKSVNYVHDKINGLLTREERAATFDGEETNSDMNCDSSDDEPPRTQR